MNAPDPAREQIESQLTFLEQTVDTLNDVILEQGRAIEDLQARLLVLERRLDAQGADGAQPESGADPLAERPPHY